MNEEKFCEAGKPKTIRKTIIHPDGRIETNMDKDHLLMILKFVSCVLSDPDKVKSISEDYAPDGLKSVQIVSEAE